MKPRTLLDRLLGRALPRYEAASSAPRLSNVTTGSLRASEAARQTKPLSERAAHYAANNPWIAAGVESLVAALVGSGIKPRPQHPDAALRALLATEWERWADESDAAGRHDIYGLQALVARAVIVEGESFVRLLADEKTGALKLSVLASEQVPRDFSSASVPGATRIVGGIEVDEHGAAVAFYVRPPDDQFGTPTRVDAADVLHILRQTLPGQIRGASWLAPVLLRTHELDQFEDATLTRAKVAALFSGFITDPQGDAGGLPGEIRAGGVLEAGLEPGSLMPLPPGTDVRFSDPVEAPSYEPFVRVHLRAIAAGLGLPYEHVSGDYAGVTYSSVRAALIEYRRRVEALQFHILVRQFCRPVWRRFVATLALRNADVAAALAADAEATLSASWLPPRFDYVDPLKDIEAERRALAAGLKSRTQALAERGYDVEEVDREIALDRAREAALGLIFDTTPSGDRVTAEAEAADEDASAAPPAPSEPQPAPSDAARHASPRRRIRGVAWR